MVNPWDEPPKPADLPDPELNPLMNPTLGKNLGRWAQVYFTSSPETREQAVEKLLRELERGELTVEASTAFPVDGGEQPRKPSDSSRSLLCSHCQEPCIPGQNYCGICGASIPRIREPQAPLTAVAPQAVREEPDSLTTSNSEDIQWLRHRSFGTESEPERSSRRTWIFAGLAFLLVLGGAAYLEWSPDKHLSNPSAAPSAAISGSDVPTPTQPAAEPAPQTAMPDTSQRAPLNYEESPAPESKVSAKKAAGATVAERPISHQVASSRPPAAAAPSIDKGSRDLAEAQRLLDGTASPRNPEVAARLLWKSVGKENAGAELALADLYARGEGVSKNCEQARLLLVAALKKGVSAAGQKLRTLESSGCR